MTATRPGEYRRMDDLVDDDGALLSPAHRVITDKLDAFETTLDHHMTTDHQAIIDAQRRLEDGQEALATAFLGPKLPPDFDGEIRRDESAGLVGEFKAMQKDLKGLHHKVDNGGVRKPLSKSQLVSIYVAAIGGAGAIIVAVIEAVSKG